MPEILSTLAGVIIGALLTILSSALQQRRQWRREDYVRKLTWEREVAKDVRTLRYHAFREYLAACNRINALRIKLDLLKNEGELEDVATQKEFQKAVGDAWVQLQEVQPIYMLVDEESALYTALRKMTEEVDTLRRRLARLDSVSWNDNEPFRDARRVCERSMGNLIIGPAVLAGSKQN